MFTGHCGNGVRWLLAVLAKYIIAACAVVRSRLSAFLRPIRSWSLFWRTHHITQQWRWCDGWFVHCFSRFQKLCIGTILVHYKKSAHLHTSAFSYDRWWWPCSTLRSTTTTHHWRGVVIGKTGRIKFKAKVSPRLRLRNIWFNTGQGANLDKRSHERNGNWQTDCRRQIRMCESNYSFSFLFQDTRWSW